MADSDLKIFKVASQTSCSVLASGLFKELTKENRPEDLRMSAIGAAAINQAMKAVASLNGFLAPRGIKASVTPCFAEKKLPDSVKAYVVLELKIEVSPL